MSMFTSVYHCSCHCSRQNTNCHARSNVVSEWVNVQIIRSMYSPVSSYEGKKKYYLMTHSAHFIHGFIASDLCKRATQMMRTETRCLFFMRYSFSIRSKEFANIYHGLSYTIRRALAEVRNSSMGPSRDIDPMIHCTMSRRSTMELRPAF